MKIRYCAFNGIIYNCMLQYSIKISWLQLSQYAFSHNIFLKGKVSGMRRHARGAMSQVNYYYTNYFVRLEEGDPPAVYDEVHHVSRNPEEWLEDFVAKHRSKTIPSM